MGWLTDSTLSKDVLPAFCKPTMVTSIWLPLSTSVSLNLVANTNGTARPRAGRQQAGCWRTYQNVFNSHSYIFLNRPAMISARFQRLPVVGSGEEDGEEEQQEEDKDCEASGGFEARKVTRRKVALENDGVGRLRWGS